MELEHVRRPSLGVHDRDGYQFSAVQVKAEQLPNMSKRTGLRIFSALALAAGKGPLVLFAEQTFDTKYPKLVDGK